MSTDQEPTPSWAQSVDAFSAAQRQSVASTSATPIQFPDTSQLGGMCGGLIGGSPFTAGLAAAGDPNAGQAGQLTTGSQFFADTLCGMAGGSGVDTTPQSIQAGAQDVHTAVNDSPMASGTIAAGGSTGNSALDAINGIQNVSDTMFAFLQGCGCAPSLSPTQASPSAIIGTVQDTADGVNNSAFASGIIAMGQDPTGTGNVALDALNGAQSFINILNGIFSVCGACLPGVSHLADTVPAGPLGIRAMLGTFAESVGPQDIITAAQDAADAMLANPYGRLALKVSGNSGNFAVDAVAASAALAASNTARHQAAQSFTPAQAVSLKAQNLLVSQDFDDPLTVAEGDNWHHDGTRGHLVPGSARVDANGIVSQLVSSEILVIPGETIEESVEVEWQGLTFTGSAPIQLGVVKYRIVKAVGGGVTYLDLGTSTVATLTPTTADSTDWTGLAGNYVVEPRVDMLRFLLMLDKNATAGSVWWDEAEFLKLDLIADECVPGTGLTVDAIVTQLYGQQGSGFTHNEEATALANNAAATTSLAARVAALETAARTGAVAADDFTWSGAITLSSNWSGSYLDSDGAANTAGYGFYEAGGSDAVWIHGSGARGSITGQFNWVGVDAVSTTDYQLIQVVLDSAPTSQYDVRRGIYTTGYIDLYGRVSTGFVSWVRLRIGGDGTWKISAYYSGAEHTIGSGTCAVPGMSSTVTFYVGDAAGTTLRHFRAEIGTTIIADLNEVGTGSNIGSGFRKWGWGGSAATYTEFHYPTFEKNTIYRGDPPLVHQWLGADQ